ALRNDSAIFIIPCARMECGKSSPFSERHANDAHLVLSLPLPEIVHLSAQLPNLAPDLPTPRSARFQSDSKQPHSETIPVASIHPGRLYTTKSPGSSEPGLRLPRFGGNCYEMLAGWSCLKTKWPSSISTWIGLPRSTSPRRMA